MRPSPRSHIVIGTGERFEESDIKKEIDIEKAEKDRLYTSRRRDHERREDQRFIDDFWEA